MTSAATSPATIAARAFQRRRGFAARQVAAGRSTSADANAKLAPWLALAAEAGADLPELLEEHKVIYPWDQAGRIFQRRMRADDICPRADRHAALARAATAQAQAQALDPSPANTEAARELLALCAALAVPVDAALTETPEIERQSA